MQGKGERKYGKKNCEVENTGKKLQSNFSGGRYWIRTSDLLRVKQTL